ncbi:substrate-binding periplasmic protein [Maridesulfovibrio frigidus]|uniref:substrate-binding periplasmic protein n=1 Tax=Maridesulfovibrio frigidus TaxID=340956 RepID=UPI00068BC2BF|nr:transporter substrate-binding domain-containing protein [Maridesulfovibrio frigidus]
MKSYKIVIILALLITLPFPALAQTTQITLATHNWCPYGCYDENDVFDGCAVRVVKYSLKQMGVELDLIVVPWLRAQRMAKDGKVDGYFAASQNQERDRNGVRSSLIAEQRWNWYMLRDNKLDPSGADFKENATVAAFRGSNMLTWLKDNGYDVTASPPTTEQLLNMLLLGRFDAMLANDMVMTDKIMKQNLHGRFKVVTLLSKPLGVYFSNAFLKNNPNFLDTFNKHVEEYMKINPLPYDSFACPLLQ